MAVTSDEFSLVVLLGVRFDWLVGNMSSGSRKSVPIKKFKKQHLPSFVDLFLKYFVKAIEDFFHVYKGSLIETLGELGEFSTVMQT